MASGARVVQLGAALLKCECALVPAIALAVLRASNRVPG